MECNLSPYDCLLHRCPSDKAGISFEEWHLTVKYLVKVLLYCAFSSALQLVVLFFAQLQMVQLGDKPKKIFRGINVQADLEHDDSYDYQIIEPM